MELFLNEKLGSISYEIDHSPNPRAVLIMAHGAGAGMNHPFMVELAKAIANLEISVVRFNFPYMEKGRKAPGSPKDAIAAWKGIAEHTKQSFPDLPMFLSGKSYGGRMASHLLAEGSKSDGIIYFGFPLHAPGRDSKDRAAHLGEIKAPQLFIQGTRDKLANIEMMNEVVELLSNAKIEQIEMADHSFNVPKSIGISKTEMLEKLASITSQWITRQLS